ncbi:hypothetical protein [Vampirovibrio sp.]|uniref:hypothetical protein n=1 Tax=Vampirovibrio sp. TaxID=2717857 RepID=UPI003593A410
MGDKHCKDVTEEMFGQEDYHFHQDNRQKSLPELESLSTQQLREKQRLSKLQKHAQNQE